MKDKEMQNVSMKEMLTKRSVEPITNCNCKVESRIDYAVRKNEDNTGLMVDLLNQEMEELQKANAIEEMAKDLKELANIVRAVLENRTDIKYIPDLAFPIAKEVINHYQPKLPEDSVVLSREEKAKLVHIDTLKDIKSISQLKELLSNITAINDLYGYNDRELEIRQEERKETAEKILNEVKNMFINTNYNIDWIVNKLEEIATREGAEVKE